MKILILDIVKSGYVGSITHRIELIENLYNIGHEVHAIVIDENIAKKMQSEGIKVHMIKISNRFLLLVVYIKTLLYLRYKYKLDIIYTRNSSLGLIGMLIWFHKNAKLIYEVNGIASDEWELSQNHPNLVETLCKKLLFSINSFVAKSANGIRAVTEGIKNEIILQGVDGKKIFVIGNGADVDIFKHIATNIAKKILRLDEDIHYVCFVGNLAPWQGVEYLVQSSPSILKEMQNTRFIIVGDGQMKEELINLAEKTGVSDKFVFTGSVPYEEVPKYINACDVCVHLPFGKRNERVGASSLKLFEYMACGKPIITTDVDGIPKEIERVNAGILVSCNLQEISGNIIKLLKSEKLREEMGKNGRKCVVENHSWENVARKVAEVCEKVIKESKSKYK